MQFIDLKRQYEILKDKIDPSIHSILDSCRFILGPEIAQLENMLAQYTNTKHCVTCGSGTDALLMPLMAWGIGPGDAVFTTPFTFIATAEVIKLVGAVPVFVDIDPISFNIDTQKLDSAINKTLTEGKYKPKAIIPVDLFGLPADYDAIDAIAKKHNLLTLEDAAQAFGAIYKNKKTCSFVNAAATSFFPAKPLACYGDGGAVFTNDDSLFDKLISIRMHGQGEDRYQHARIGINGRMDSIQAAVLIAKMSIFDDEIAKRNIVANKYNEALNKLVITPAVPDFATSVWAQYSVLADNAAHRADLQANLKKNDVPTAIYYPIPLHLQPAFADLNYSKNDFPVAESISERIFSIPMHPYINDDEIELIAKSFNL